jgi:hypothetical protein
VQEKKSFLAHTTVEGFQHNHRGNRTYVIGIDIRYVAASVSANQDGVHSLVVLAASGITTVKQYSAIQDCMHKQVRIPNYEHFFTNFAATSGVQ